MVLGIMPHLRFISSRPPNSYFVVGELFLGLLFVFFVHVRTRNDKSQIL